jgi:hypothetical protein
MDLVEFEMRIEFFRDDDFRYGGRAKPVDPEATEYLGSMTKAGVKAVALPRVGDMWFHETGRLSPAYLVEITGVEHRFSARWIGAGESSDGPSEAKPQATIIIQQRAPGAGEMDQFVAEFQKNGWRWEDHGIKVAEMRAEDKERSALV